MPTLIRFVAYSLSLSRNLAIWLPICFLSEIGNIDIFNVGGIEMTAQANAAKFEALTGAVTGPSGRPVAGASVNARPLYPGIPVSQIEIITDAEGYYRWLLLPGRYSIMASKDGFQPATQSIVIKRGESARKQET